ncbi:MAG TPA: hypothetical protein VLB50_11250 [Ignavibacteriaceae bacterium]|nr:hypothetical protein [Ignavibacteriaceae bacterium]
MKTLVSVLLLSSLMFAPILAGSSGAKSQLNTTAIVANLTEGLSSDNEGLRISSAAVIEEVIDHSVVKPGEFSGSLIPLLRMLDNGKTEFERMTAALTLYSIDNSIGIYRLRGSARFDASEKVRTISKNLYYGYHTIHNSTYFLDF